MTEIIKNEDRYMREALKEAKIAYELGEIPVGCVIVANNRVIAKGHNQVEKLTDSTAHAEMIALTSAFNFLQSKFIQNCDIYITLEPCPMCAGAIMHARPKRLIYAAKDEKSGYKKYSNKIVHPKTEIISGVLSTEAESLLHSFFKKLREE